MLLWFSVAVLNLVLIGDPDGWIDEVPTAAVMAALELVIFAQKL